jgi:uncharacterized protein involved in exopolysaccharide biosynthesis
MTTEKQIEKLERQIKQISGEIVAEENAYKAIIERRKKKLAERKDYLKILKSSK